MSLYRTPRGTWAGTEAEARKACKLEGSKSGAFKKVDTPGDKAAWLRLLNGAKAPAPAPAPTTHEPGNSTTEILGQGPGWIKRRMVMHGENQQQLPRQPVPVSYRTGKRWRVYCNQLFTGIGIAKTEEDAIRQVRDGSSWRARVDTSHTHTVSSQTEDQEGGDTSS
jgi:hypothetical protein